MMTTSHSEPCQVEEESKSLLSPLSYLDSIASGDLSRSLLSRTGKEENRILIQFSTLSESSPTYLLADADLDECTLSVYTHTTIATERKKC